MASITVRTIDSGIRIRETPADGRPIGQAGLGQTLESLESAAETRRKLGKQDEWLRIRKVDGTVGYIAAWLLEAVNVPAEEVLVVVVTSQGLRIRETPMTGRPVASLRLNERVECLEPTSAARAKLGVLGEWLNVRRDDGTIGYAAAWFLAQASEDVEPDTDADEDSDGPISLTPVDDTPPVPTRLYVRPTENGLRLRETPRDGAAIGSAGTTTILEVLEDVTAARLKIGVQGEWLNVKRLDGLTGYIAAWYMVESPAPSPLIRPGALNIIGVNLDNFHPLGQPDPARFKGLGWVRFNYNVSMGRGSNDIQAAYNLYRPLLERYARAGLKVMLVATHQFYGEGRNEFWPWQAMTGTKWQALSERYTEMLHNVARQFAGENLVHAWQIWNEQDAPLGAEASVPMPVHSYAELLGSSVEAVSAADPSVAVITGGHTGGPGRGSGYAKQTVALLSDKQLPHGIAFHPYGRGTRPFTRYANFGDIREELNAYMSVLPDRPVYISEWGTLDKEGDNPAEVAQYAAEFVEVVVRDYPGKVAALIWYAWAMGMHNGFGLVGRDDRPLQPLFDRFLTLRG